MKDRTNTPSTKSSDSSFHSTIEKKTATRLAAIQALYQMEFNSSNINVVLEEFRAYRIDIGDNDVNGRMPASFSLLQELVIGTDRSLTEIDRYLSTFLDETWPLDRIATVMRCILRLATFELMARHQVPAKVIIKEYIKLAYEFFSGAEPGMVNGVLDKIAHELRNTELECSNEKESTSRE